jgi:hypothetical protein
MAVDFKEHLKKQIRFLERSAAAFDQGETDEAIRIAVCLRILFHDTNSQKSLLTRLDGWGIRLNSTASDIDEHAQWTDQLSGLGPDGVIPRLDAFFPQTVHLAKDWWETQIVYVSPAIGRLTRRRVALTAADKDGGAHVDSHLTADYEALTTFWTHGHDGEGWLVEPTHLTGLRQMAYEILHSPELLALAEEP